ncbi:hypothetical protein LXT21_06880 [Myxococcus sp. K38C18041901]|uniref:hypothetical protein n=1 Tax=Myxococcus guangdongensis TaxID=2906760 RepID=UPI0020A72EB1|nr:hypothetical protein [Myxococcus guangdongensis]MCP3058490.1 hypothetical protein [Myxococcus guangdongensis]
MLASLITVLALTLASAPPSQDPTAPTCRMMNSQVACGYGCKTDSNRARCAQTPQGRCQLIDGQAVCFDPPAYVVKAYGASLPEPECKAIDGAVACGYHCVTQPGRVKCAKSPAGVCKARGGEVECFDPPAVVFAVYGKETPRADCRSNGVELTCGYNCLNASEGVRCTRTPAGVCKISSGRITCFDPSPAALCTWKRAMPAPECRNTETGPACGYACTTAFSKSACASTPSGICKVFDSEVHCFDPPVEQQADPACLSVLGMAALDGAAP